MRLERRFTRAGGSPFEGMAFRAGDSEIRNPDGTIVFQQRGIEVPAAWSQVATDVPEWLWRSVPDDAAADQALGGETSAQQVFHRMAGAWTYWGWKGGYFDSEADARTF